MLEIAIIANGFQKHYILNLCQKLASNKVKVNLIGSDIYNDFKFLPNVHFFNLRGSHDEESFLLIKIGRLSKYYWRISLYAFRSKVKVFHIQWLRFNFFEGVVLNWLFKILGKKIIYTAHDVLPHHKDNVINRVMFRCIYHTVDLIVVHSNFIKQRIICEFGVKDERIEVVKHGTYDIQSTLNLTKEDARFKLGLHNKNKVILFFGHITPYKGLNILIPAFLRIRSAIGDFKLIIAGKVDPNYKEKLNELIYHKELINSLVTRFGYVNDDEVEILFKACDVVILPYLEASQSGVLFLSYAYGRPVIISNIGSFSEDVLNGKTGCVFEMGNDEDLFNKIDIFFREKWPFNEESGSFIKQYAYSKYSWEETAKNLICIYGRFC